MEEILAALERIAAEKGVAEKGAAPPEWKAAVAATQAEPPAKRPAEIKRPTPVRPPVEPPPKKKKKNGCLPWILGFIGFVVLLGVIGSCIPDPAETVTQYVTRSVNVRSTASAEEPSVTKLERGAEVTGSWVTGKDGETPWLKLKDGPYSGDFVWGRNLSERPRPTLTRLTGTKMRVRVAGEIHQEPDLTTTKLADVAVGETLTTVGTTADGWTEVALNKGGVGYVQTSLFGRAASRGKTKR